MTNATPLVDPDGYFARADALSLSRAAAVVVGFWLATTAVGFLQRVADGAALTPLFVLQTLEATLLYWVVPTFLLYGLVAAIGDSGVEPADALALAAWGLVPLLAGTVATTLLYAALAALGVEPAGTPAEPTLLLLAPLTLLACGWAAFVWRSGLRRGAALSRTAATAVALLAAATCAALLLLPAALG